MEMSTDSSLPNTGTKTLERFGSTGCSTAVVVIHPEVGKEEWPGVKSPSFRLSI